MEEKPQSHVKAGIDLLYTIGPFDDLPPAAGPEEGQAPDSDDNDARITRLAWSPDGKMLAVPCRNHRVYLCDGKTGEVKDTLEGHRKPVLSTSWSPDGSRLASAGWDATVRVWDMRGGSTITVLREFAREVNTVAWSPDGAMLATSDEEEGVCLWDSSSWKPTRRLKPLRASHIAWSPNCAFLACASVSGGITVWDIMNMEPCAALEGHVRESVMVAWSPDSRMLASAAKDGTIRLWDTVDEVPLARMDIDTDDHDLARQGRALDPKTHQVIALSFMNDGRILAAKCRDGRIRLWDCDSWHSVRTLDESATYSGWCVGLSFHPTLPLLATLGAKDTIVRVWRLDPDFILIGVLDPDRL